MVETRAQGSASATSCQPYVAQMFSTDHWRLRMGLRFASFSNFTVVLAAFALALYNLNQAGIAMQHGEPVNSLSGLMCAITSGICYVIITVRWRRFTSQQKTLCTAILIVASLWIVWVLYDAFRGWRA